MNKSKIMSKLEEYGATLLVNTAGQQKYAERTYAPDTFIHIYGNSSNVQGYKYGRDWQDGYQFYHVQTSAGIKLFLTLDAIAAWVTGELAMRALLAEAQETCEKLPEPISQALQ